MTVHATSTRPVLTARDLFVRFDLILMFGLIWFALQGSSAMDAWLDLVSASRVGGSGLGFGVGG